MKHALKRDDAGQGSLGVAGNKRGSPIGTHACIRSARACGIMFCRADNVRVARKDPAAIGDGLAARQSSRASKTIKDSIGNVEKNRLANALSLPLRQSLVS